MIMFNHKYNGIIIVYFFLLFTSCSGNNPTTKNEIITQNISRIDSLRNLVLSSNFPFEDDISKNKINILIDSEKDCVYLCKLFYETDGTGTLGWIEYDTRQKILRNISPWLEDSEILSFDQQWAISSLTCQRSSEVDLALNNNQQQGLLYTIKHFPFCSQEYIKKQGNFQASNYFIPDYLVSFIDSLNYDSSGMNIIELSSIPLEVKVLICEVFRGESTYFIITTILDGIIIHYKEIGYTGSDNLIFRDFCISQDLEINTNKVHYVYDDLELKANDTLEITNYKISKDGNFIISEDRIRQ